MLITADASTPSAAPVDEVAGTSVVSEGRGRTAEEDYEFQKLGSEHEQVEQDVLRQRATAATPSCKSLHETHHCQNLCKNLNTCG